ncbi:phosphoribosyltransferase [Propionivibrio sp.]|uniref:phosphoribosyltransferase n=1 Tax=Propionivibrio sp. TaxID=2212460 RepID=UPI003BEF8E1E
MLAMHNSLFDQSTTHPQRATWSEFPDVLIHAKEPAVKGHPAYREAKAGDVLAAQVLIRDNFNPAKVAALEALLPGVQPLLVSAHAFEREGVNAIPEVFADVLGQTLGWPVDAGVVQTNVVGHTGADGFSRLARQASFSGPIIPGADYVMVDDFIGMGGTLANLRGYIESQGGRVLAAVALTGKPYSAKLSSSPERIQELRKKHGNELENWWCARFGHAFDALTESEARYLVRTENADTIRNRIAAAE